MEKEEDKRAKIGVGIVTYNRPGYFRVAMASVDQHLGFADEVIAYHDGPRPEGYDWDDTRIKFGKENKGVAHAKNQLIRELLSRGCEYLFIMEDDMEIVSRNAIVHYLAAHRMTGVPHLLFAHHGPGNAQLDSLVGKDSPLLYWKACVGAWNFYTREVIETVGYMDENFRNAWEHVEHTWRIMKHFGAPYGYYPDVIDSQRFIREQDGAIENSSIGQQDNPERLKVIIEGLEYWKTKDPEFPAQHTLDHYINLLEDMEEA